MKSFSQRKGFMPVKDVIQKDSIDDDLRNGLWNAFAGYFWPAYGFYPEVSRLIWVEYFKKTFDTMSTDSQKALRTFRNYFFECNWYEVYDFLEFCANILPSNPVSNEFYLECNRVLKREISAYRLVNGQFVEITSDEEIASIEDAVAASPDPVKEHLGQALRLFSDRENPDYRNSIKESISAVEAISSKIAGHPKAELGPALNKIKSEGKIILHGALKGGFEKLYGYTSDGDGIRHALMQAPNVDAEDAKFMLVSCSAFINYLIVKADKAGIEL